jgi:glyoxylase-like metal-dependent hydrolase (beta-lactamase superfamily II)
MPFAIKTTCSIAFNWRHSGRAPFVRRFVVSNESFHFKVGAIECIAVSDGTFAYAPDAFVANAPVERFEQELRDHNLPAHEVISPYTCLFVNTGKNRLLVDTGAGFAPTNGKLLDNLAALGVAAAEIDTIVLTHGHADHIGGAADNAGAPLFPNARYVMWQSEWEFWTQERPDLGAMPTDDHIKHLLIDFAHAKLPPIRSQIDLIDREIEIVPGVYAIPAPGHTPGHIALLISSGDQQLLHMADTVLHPILMEHPEWRPSFDLMQEQAAATKRRILDRAAADQVLALAFHFPFPGLGRVLAKGDAWQWQPIDASEQGASSRSAGM